MSRVNKYIRRERCRYWIILVVFCIKQSHVIGPLKDRYFSEM